MTSLTQWTWVWASSGSWWRIGKPRMLVYGVTKSQTRLSDWTVQLFATPWTSAHQASLSITNSQSPPKPVSIESMTPSNYLILCHPFLFLPSIFPSITIFSNESVLHIRWTKYWSFSFTISLSNEYSGLIPFRMDWFYLLPAQGTLKIFSSTTVQKHQLFSAQLSSQSNSHIHTWPLEKP